MTNDLEALARRAVASHHFRWMPGMVTETGVRVLRRDTDGYTIGYGPRTSYCIMEVTSDALPDLSDPATLGCLLAIVRKRFPNATTATDDERWWIADMIPALPTEATEAAALVAALEAAP